MKEGLELLYALQQQDDQLVDIQTLIKEIPADIEKLEEERDGKASMIEKAKVKLNDNVKSREKLEKEILLVKEKISKYKDQMSKATTNKEYQGFMSEIQYEENNILSVEEKIIEKMVESDEIMEEIRKCEGDFNQVASSYNKKITDMTANLDYNKTRLSEKKSEKGALRKQIPANLLRTYDNLSKNKGGKAISYVETEFCGVCNVKIRPQRLSELITTDQTFACESCGRLLFKKVDAQEEEQD